jgi:hypothetical protein
MAIECFDQALNLEFKGKNIHYKFGMALLSVGRH